MRGSLSNRAFAIARRQRRHAKAGFTLVELLVVVLIIGLLSAIAFPQYHKVMERAKLSEVQAYFGALKNAEDRYLVYKGRYCYDMYAVECGFDITLPPLKYFSADYTITERTAGGRTDWHTSVNRNSDWYGGPLPYVVQYGSNQSKFTIICMNSTCGDLFADMNPLAMPF